MKKRKFDRPREQRVYGEARKQAGDLDIARKELNKSHDARTRKGEEVS